jgi:hypothetical protein
VVEEPPWVVSVVDETGVSVVVVDTAGPVPVVGTVVLTVSANPGSSGVDKER